MPLVIQQSATRTISRHKPTNHVQNAVWLITAMIPAVLLVVCGIVCSGSFQQSPKTKQADTRDLKSEAMQLAREAVTQFVTFPRDAEFGWLSEVEKTSYGHWIVSGEVKTINAFGAKITHGYRVTLFHSPRDEQWSIGEVEIDDTVAYSDEKTLSRRTITRPVKKD